MDVGVLAGARDVLGKNEGALEQQHLRPQDLRRGVEDFVSTISGVCKERNLLAPCDRGALAAQRGDLLARPARELVEELVLHFGEEIADRRNAVAARENAQLEIVPKREVIAGLRRNHLRLVANVLETLARTIRRLSDRVEDLTFLDVPSRVAKYLLDLTATSGGPTPLELSLTQDELAAFVGASRVSVNRELGDLERRDIVGVHRRRIVIKDPERLSKEVRF